jgi:hypothetical protein
MYKTCKVNFKCGVSEELAGNAFSYIIRDTIIIIMCHEQFSCITNRVEYEILYNLVDINSVEFR